MKLLNFKINRKYKNIPRSRLVLLVSSALLLLFSFGLAKELISRYQVARQINDLKDSVAELEGDNTKLGELISSWENSNRLEKEARLKLGLQKPGEKAVLIVRDKSESGTEQVGANQKIVGKFMVEDQAEPANLTKWWQYFFGKKQDTRNK